MQFTQRASVFTADDKEVGRIDRVVIHPKTKEVTHIVIRKGFLFTKDKVVPLNLIALGQGERITLRMDEDKLEQLPNFEETHYVVLNEEELEHDAWGAPTGMASALYWYPPYGETPVAPYTELPYAKETHENIPAGTVAVREGAKVITRDGKHIGNVEQVLTSPKADRATHFMISKGLLLKERKLVPVEWIGSLGEDEVRLAVGARIIEELREHEHA